MRVGILIFDGVEELDFVGPWEVLSSVNVFRPDSLHLQLVGTHTPIRAYHGLRVLPDLTMDQCPQLDWLIVPGGAGRQQQMHQADTLGFVRAQYPRLTYLASVCTGTFILAEAGLLEGRTATTHHSALAELASYPVQVVQSRLTRSDNVICAAGVTAGMDLGFYLVQESFGRDTAAAVARRMEYPFSGEEIQVHRG